MTTTDAFAGRSIREVLDHYGIRLDHDLGQNFLTDPALLQRIAGHAEAGPGDLIIEVGCGAGTLTAALAETGADVIGIEIDERLRSLLEDRFTACPRVRFLFQDALKVDLSALAAGYSRVHIVSNVPYYITTPLTERFLLMRPLPLTVVLTVQKEAADHILAQSGKQYGPLPILVALTGPARIEEKLSPDRFLPPPRVSSAVLVIKNAMAEEKTQSSTRQPADLLTEEERTTFYSFLKTCFTQRRKTLLNNLKQSSWLATPMQKDNFSAFLQDDKVGLSKRPESMQPRDFFALYRLLS